MAVLKYKKDGVWYTLAGASSGISETRVLELINESINKSDASFAEMDVIIGITEDMGLSVMDYVIGGE